MKEITLFIEKQEDGWYLASTKNTLKKGGFSTEAPDIKTLRQKIREAVNFHLSGGYYKELDLPENPKIRMIYSEQLYNNPNAEKILVMGSQTAGGYQAKCNSYVNLDLQHSSFEELQRMIADAIKVQGHQDKHVEFRLEWVLE